MHCNHCIRSNELTLQAVAGWVDITGCPRQERLAVGGYPASSLWGAHVAFIALASLFEKEVDEQREIEVDCFTILLSAIEAMSGLAASTRIYATRSLTI